MLIQFGYIFLFAPVYPLASLFALVNNLVEIHSDSFKLVKLSRRPFPEYNTSTKFWEYGFSAMALCGVFVNSELIRNSGAVGAAPFARVTFLFGAAFVLAFAVVKRFLVGIFNNMEDSSKIA